MKVFYLETFLIITSTVSNISDAKTVTRSLRGVMHGHHGGSGQQGGQLFGQGGQGYGHHGGDRGPPPPPPFMQAMFDDQCLGYDCDAIEKSNIDCNIPMPESPDIATVTKSMLNAAREERHQQILHCGCCPGTATTNGDSIPGDEGGWSPGYGHGHHGGPGGHPFMQMMIEEECDAFMCDDIDTDNLNCDIERPDRPDFATMTDQEREDAWIAMQVDREQHHQQVQSCVCCANATIEELFPEYDEDSFHAFGHGHGHHGGPGGRPFMQMMIDDECDTFMCEDIDTDNLDCDIERPERPIFATMTDQEREDAWIAMQADREEHHQQVQSCICCANATIEEMFPEYDEDFFHAFGHGPGYHNNNNNGDGPPVDAEISREGEDASSPSFGSNGMMTSSNDGMLSSSSYDGMMGTSHNEMTSSSSHDGFGFGHHGHHGHHGKGPGTSKAQQILKTQCPNHACPNKEGDSETTAVSCPRLDAVMAMSKDERRQTTLDCVCCREDGVSELEDLNDEVEVSVLLSSLLPAASESGMQENVAVRNVVTMSSGLAATIVYFFAVV